MMLGFFASAPAPRYRPMTIDDAADCARLHAAGFHRAWSMLDFERLIREPQVLGDVAVKGNSGQLDGFVISRLAADEAEILSVVVDPSRRRGGIGRALMRYHRASLAARGVRNVFLEVDEQNMAALTLYRREGFIEVGRRPAYYTRPDGTRASAAIMRCEIA